MHRTHFEQQLDDVTSRLVSMSRFVEDLIASAFEALFEQDPASAEAVILGDREVDATEVEVEEQCVELLALHQPMARDLRQLVTILKINNDLERVGDHAVNIAEAAQRLMVRDSATLPIELTEAAGIARGMLRDALDAFVQQDGVKARAVCARDDRVDQLHDGLIRAMLTVMMESPSRISESMNIITVSRNVERVADLATNIGEDVVYLVEGQTIRHPERLKSK